MDRRWLVAGLLAAMAGCATTGQGGDIVVDMTGVDPDRYLSDLQACRAYANQAPIGREAAKGAAGGAAVGAAVGAILGGGEGAARGAGAGAVTGGAKGGLRGAERKRQIVRRCMSGRGYNVLG